MRYNKVSKLLKIAHIHAKHVEYLQRYAHLVRLMSFTKIYWTILVWKNVLLVLLVMINSNALNVVQNAVYVLELQITAHNVKTQVYFFIKELGNVLNHALMDNLLIN